MPEDDLKTLDLLLCLSMSLSIYLSEHEQGEGADGH
jgi:hypothetical protein